MGLDIWVQLFNTIGLSFVSFQVQTSSGWALVDSVMGMVGWIIFGAGCS